MNLPPIDTLTLQDARDEVARLRAELEQQRTRAEGAEQELCCFQKHISDVDRIERPVVEAMRAKLAAARAHLSGVDVAKLDKDELTSTHAVTNWWEMRKLLAAAREVLS